VAASTWPHWELQLLHAAGLPTTGNRPSASFYGTINWLADWNLYEKPSCDRNPLNTSRRAAGSTACKKLPGGKTARNYASRDSSAQAFAEQLNLTDYPHIREALGTGDPNGYPDRLGLAGDLAKWGAIQYANVINAAAMPQTSPPSSGADKQQSNVSGAWTYLHRVLANEGTATIRELEASAAALRRIERRLERV